MKNILIITDMQEDFIDGVLAVGGAKEMANELALYLEDKAAKYDEILFLRDSHAAAFYEGTIEANAYIMHTEVGTNGHNIYKPLTKFIRNKESIYDKNTFASFQLALKLAQSSTNKRGLGLNITLCGVLTDVCVISMGLVLRSILPCAEINVLEKYCRGSEKGKHDAALEIMDSNLINILWEV